MATTSTVRARVAGAARSQAPSRGAESTERYTASVPPDRRWAFRRLVEGVRAHIDPRFQETFLFGMPCWVVPHEVYPAGYHVDPSLGLPFLSLANQQHYIAYFHMALAADPATRAWFQQEFARSGTQANMGRHCVRFTSMHRIPFELMSRLAGRVSADEYVAMYRRTLGR